MRSPLNPYHRPGRRRSQARQVLRPILAASVVGAELTEFVATAGAAGGETMTPPSFSG